MEIKPAQKKEKVYQAVFADIVKGKYTYDSIINEGALVAKYKVSKSPVREALLELCNENILQSVPRMGYRIKPLNYQELNDALAVRAVIELAALDASFPHITTGDLDRLEAMAEKNHDEIASYDPYQRWVTNRDFHITLCSYSRNKYFVSTLDALMKVCLRGAPEFFGSPWDRDLEASHEGRHFLMIDALRKGDVGKAKEILKEDITDYKSAFSQ